MDVHTGWCEGCLRRLEEIARWSAMDAHERRAVWLRIGERAAQLQAGAVVKGAEDTRG